MASATRNEIVTTTVVSIQLTLSEDEARALRDVLGHVGGPPDTTRRGLIQEIHIALGTAGFRWKGPVTDLIGEIELTPTETED